LQWSRRGEEAQKGRETTLKSLDIGFDHHRETNRPSAQCVSIVSVGQRPAFHGTRKTFHVCVARCRPKVKSSSRLSRARELSLIVERGKGQLNESPHRTESNHANN
jgi:hypothetical protein